MKAATHVALSIGVERALAQRGEGGETQFDRLPAGTFPHVHALRDEAAADPEIAWEFSVETLVAGLRAQIRRAKTRQS